MLTGRAAAQRPDVNELAKQPIIVAVHDVRHVPGGVAVRRSGAPATTPGLIGRESGEYVADANRLTAEQRRAAGIRRNGQPRRRREVEESA